MAKALASYPAWAVQGGPLYVASGSAILNGILVGADSDGKIRPGDYRAAQGPILAFGAATHDAQQKDPKGNVLRTEPQIGYAHQGKLSGLVGLTPGKQYFLFTGGLVTGSSPAAAASGNIEQVVGVALSATELLLMIGSPIVR